MLTSYKKLQMVGLTPARWRISPEILLLVHNDNAGSTWEFMASAASDGDDLLFFDVPVTISEAIVSDWSLDTLTGVSIVGHWHDRSLSAGTPETAVPMPVPDGRKRITLH